MEHVAPAIVWSINGFIAISFLAGITFKLAPLFRKLQQFLDDFQGEQDRPGVPGRPGVMKRLETLEDDMKGIKRMLSDYQ